VAQMGITLYANTDYSGLAAANTHRKYEPEWFLSYLKLTPIPTEWVE